MSSIVLISQGTSALVGVQALGHWNMWSAVLCWDKKVEVSQSEGQDPSEMHDMRTEGWEVCQTACNILHVQTADSMTEY